VNTLRLGYKKTNQLILFRELIAVCSAIHTKHINALCGQNVEFVNVKLGGKIRWAGRAARMGKKCVQGLGGET